MNITSSFVTWLRIMNIAAPSAHPKFISRLQVCFILGGHDLLGKLDISSTMDVIIGLIFCTSG